MKTKGLFALAVATMALGSWIGYQEEGAAAAGAKIELRVLYAGHPGSAREKDFVAFLEKHFTKVVKGDLDTFKEKDAEDFDVVILDYSGLTVKGNAIIMPELPFSRKYSRPTVTVGATGALVSDSLNLKTGYL